MLAVCMILSVPFVGCSAFVNSFKPVPGQPPMTLPVREMVHGTMKSVSVVIAPGDWSPMCMLPDAANDISCHFTYGWFENGGMITVGPDAYRHLTTLDARKACETAMWSVHGGSNEIEACTRALMFHRWMVDGDAFGGNE